MPSFIYHEYMMSSNILKRVTSLDGWPSLRHEVGCFRQQRAFREKPQDSFNPDQIRPLTGDFMSKQPKTQSEPRPTDKQSAKPPLTQREKFIKAAREAECDETGEALRTIARAGKR